MSSIFLSKPSSYGTAVEPVEIIQTHVSLVFLAGACAFKLKRAMKFPYLDFSTVGQRRVACEAELALNRRTATKLYLEDRALTRAADGGVGFGTEGPVVNHSLFNRCARRTYKPCTNLIDRSRRLQC
jgi:aminoglycoside phosphotransferase family enzyme